jgi:hypothetical protein
LTGLPARLEPGKVISHRAVLHVGDLGAEDAVLVWLVVEAPVETRVVLQVAVPGLGDVYFAVCGPGEWLLGEKPEGWPYARCAG